MGSSEIAETKAICEIKRNEEVGFVNNLKNTFISLTQTSINDHKTFFIASLKKVYDNVKMDVSPTKAAEDRCFQAFDVFQ